ncbi:MAG TPA: Wzt carbohydrate-binding domain-containing protein, partial [Actinomycetota bacterium]|nr:Wzt carbohydrate-binding domain-containing protein [Actinomycetota bacterium]
NSLLRRVRTGKYYPGDVVEVRFTQQMNLLPGKYVFSALVATRDGSQWYDWWDDCLPFHVLGNEGDTGFVDLDSDMHFEKVSPAADTGSPVLPDTP